MNMLEQVSTDYHQMSLGFWARAGGGDWARGFLSSEVPYIVDNGHGGPPNNYKHNLPTTSLAGGDKETPLHSLV